MLGILRLQHQAIVIGALKHVKHFVAVEEPGHFAT